MQTRTITTYHGQNVQVRVGTWVVNEYYKGFLNRVHPMESREGALRMKETLEMSESYMMTKTKHFRIQEVR